MKKYTYQSLVWASMHYELGQLCFATNWDKCCYILGQPSFRSSRPEVFCKKGVLENFEKFTGKHRNFQEHLFLKKTSGGCFYSYYQLQHILLGIGAIITNQNNRYYKLGHGNRQYKIEESKKVSDRLLMSESNVFICASIRGTLVKSCTVSPFKFFGSWVNPWFLYTEPVVQRCSVKNVFLEISQNSQENTCTRVSFLIKLQVHVFSFEFCEISENTFSY